MWIALLPLMKPPPATPRISAGSKAACAHDRASNALLRPSIPFEAQAFGTLRPDADAAPDTTSCADISGRRQHDICSPKSCGLGSRTRSSAEFLSCEWLLTLELR